MFFEADDYRLYRRLVAAAARRAGAAVWAYCLMPNHVYLPIMPTWRDAGGRGRVAGNLCRSAPALHRGHQRAVPLDGPLFQGRFGAVVMDEPHLLAAARYIALNPVAAGMVGRAEDWPWSSARAQLADEDDELATVAPLRALISDFATLLAMPTDAMTTTRIERARTIGRPLGSAEWIAMLERRPGRPLSPRKPGPKPRLGAGRRTASAAAVKPRVNCHRNSDLNAKLTACRSSFQRASSGEGEKHSSALI
jgi:putative transposase